MAMLHKEVFMKRNILIALLLTFTMMLVTACGSNSSNKNDNNKFEGTWIAYNQKSDPNQIQEFTFENVDDQLLVSLYTYSYTPLMDYFSSGLDEADSTKQGTDTAPANADYLLTKKRDSIHNMLRTAVNNKLDVGPNPILYNEKDDTLVYDNVVFHKQSDDNSVKAYLSKLKDAMKDDVIQGRKQDTVGSFRPKPNIQFNFSFDDSILDTAQ